MQKLISLLDGKKTFIISLLGIGVVALWLSGVIDREMADQILVLLGFGGLASLRHGLMKIDK